MKSLGHKWMTIKEVTLVTSDAELLSVDGMIVVGEQIVGLQGN